MGLSKSSSKRVVYGDTIIPQEARKALTRQPNSTPKAAGKRRTKRPQSLQKERIIKIRAEINEKEMKEAVAKINKTKSWFFGKINKIVSQTHQRKRGEKSMQ